jgi:hypothetical protein
MSDAADRLARNRQALLEHMARKQRRHDPREERASAGYDTGYGAGQVPPEYDDEPASSGGGWFGHLRHALRTWWRYHPAHMAVELATPMMQGYARRKPVQLLGISLAAGALLTFARPWKVISVTTIIVALLKSSQLSHLFTAAMSAADYRKDHNRPE